MQHDKDALVHEPRRQAGRQPPWIVAQTASHVPLLSLWLRAQVLCPYMCALLAALLLAHTHTHIWAVHGGNSAFECTCVRAWESTVRLCLTSKSNIDSQWPILNANKYSSIAKINSIFYLYVNWRWKKTRNTFLKLKKSQIKSSDFHNIFLWAKNLKFYNTWAFIASPCPKGNLVFMAGKSLKAYVDMCLLNYFCWIYAAK